MLTALDFPRDLFYSAHATWVRVDGAGAVRLGLNPAALGYRTDVVHVSLPVEDKRLTRGQVFGRIEFETGSFDLIAPVSGVVFVTNRSLARSSACVSSDPFDSGYLLDLEGVRPAELEELMDWQQAMLHYSKLPSSKTVDVYQRVQAGQPWPRQLELRVDAVCIATGELVPPQANPLLTPDWQSGDTWSTRAHNGAGETLTEYTVDGTDVVGGAAVWRLHVRSLNEEADAQQAFYLGKNDFTVVAWDSVPSTNTALFKRHWHKNPDTWLDLEAQVGFPALIPRLPQGARFDETRQLASTPEQEITQACRFFEGGDRCQVEVTVETQPAPGKPGKPSTRTIHQVWQAGAPWWVHSTQLVDDQLLVRTELIVNSGTGR